MSLAAWQKVGAAAKRKDIADHGELLAATAPLLLQALHTSMNRTLKVLPDGRPTTNNAVERERVRVVVWRDGVIWMHGKC